MIELTEYATLRGAQKAAVLMTVLGDDAAATIFRNLPEDDLQVLTREISNLGRVAPQVSMQVLKEYHGLKTARKVCSTRWCAPKN